ncbi:hypothetical protein BV22DRAFT_1036046 [Leucogyrophana mollusca]|uniref:Uncharacterized protein n=1 Tax=Leucogyrophana mollusca TaxID=85980 RepID=A0ACB8BDA8_9AGAM|nr:hypothetical protein BV22DRAFT_1036046 [Leucogyrophana mollusca]
MTLLHVYFTLRNQQAFQRLLEGTGSRGQSSSSTAGLSTSGGKSWTRSSTLTSVVATDVNALDSLGRTVLHLACSSIEPSSVEYVRMLLAHPIININAQDTEGHWTALHRALYHGNIAAATLLLRRPEVDTSMKDHEGYTAFDLYNSTLRTTKPSSFDGGSADLFTWGTNRNAALGLGDGNDRVYPDQVVIPHKDDPITRQKKSIEERFSPIQVRQLAMSRLHTVILTSETRDNVRVCGFGGGGRLGPNQHTQYSLVPLPDFMHTIDSVAIGQDHTLALTTTGEVLSWGLNRFSQLGYVVEQPSNGRLEEPIQSSPRKIGSLKKEHVRGVAACKTASACFTSTEVYTWGTNGGQLGYSKTATPVQVLPRKVASIVQPVSAISMTDTAMACLLDNGEVACVWNAGVTKINFPIQNFPLEMYVYRPPQAVKGPNITKLTSCDDTFAALSSNGEVFTFCPPNAGDGEGSSSKGLQAIKPQRVWALRRQFSGVRDVALGADGSIIVCTQSGHVFVRTRNTKSGQSASVKAFKFQRVPYIQRVVAVCANNTGALAALRVDHEPSPIRLTGRSLSGDIAEIQPYLSFASGGGQTGQLTGSPVISPSFGDADDEIEDASILDDISALSLLLDLLNQKRAAGKTSKVSLHDGDHLPHGADLLLHFSPRAEFPIHRVILATRCVSLCIVLSSGDALHDKESKIVIKLSHVASVTGSHKAPRLHFSGCSIISVLILLRYLYSDQLLAIWDRRIGSPFSEHFRRLDVKPTQVKLDLQSLAHLLDLPLLSQALESPGKRSPVPSEGRDFRRLFDASQAQANTRSEVRRSTKEDPLAPDVMLHLADKVVYCHSAILRARCTFFMSFFSDVEWTIKRRDAFGIVDVDMKHLRWQVMDYVLRFVCCGEEELFETLNFAQSVDDVLEFMFDVMAAANELLLDRLVLLCSQVILKYMNISNVCYLLTDASHFHAVDLVESVQEYMAANLEVLLEGKMLDDLAPPLIKQLSEYVRTSQAHKSPVSRSNKLAKEALERHREWLALQDIPQPFVPTSTGKAHTNKESSPRLSPPSRRKRLPSLGNTPMVSPVLRPQPSPRMLSSREPSGDDIFIMDDADAVPALELTKSEAAVVENAPKPAAVWKRTSSAPRTDLKSIMAEAESRNTLPSARKLPPPMMQHAPSRESLRPNPNYKQAAAASPSRQIPRTIPALDAPPTTPPRNPPAPSAQRSVAGRTRMQPDLAPTGATPSGLGPVISPVRQIPSPAAGPSAPRHVSGSASAWTLPPVQPVVQPNAHGSAPSFAEIQKLQLTQGAPVLKDKRSLLEIQQEEQVRRQEEEARQQEEEFLKWWAAEEARVQAELSSQRQPTRQGRSGKKPKPAQGKVSKTMDVQPASTSSGGPQPKPRRREKQLHGVTASKS